MGHKFNTGDIVTLKSHPLAFMQNGLIDCYIKQVPPLMLVKEIHIEHKKKMFSEAKGEWQIADKVKYVCVYFNQHRTIFEEKSLYESVLISFEKLIFHRKKADGSNGVTLIKETKDYKPLEYKFGEIAFLRTYKLENRKKTKYATLSPESSTKTLSTNTSPAFIMNGIKENDQKDLYDQRKGLLIRKTCQTLLKVIWYNSYQEKYSEEYVPIEFFTNDSLITYSRSSKESISINEIITQNEIEAVEVKEEEEKS
jgi:hypothetical protein